MSEEPSIHFAVARPAPVPRPHGNAPGQVEPLGVVSGASLLIKGSDRLGSDRQLPSIRAHFCRRVCAPLLFIAVDRAVPSHLAAGTPGGGPGRQGASAPGQQPDDMEMTYACVTGCPSAIWTLLLALD